MTPPANDPLRTGNHLLDLLPPQDRRRVADACERMTVPVKTLAGESGEPFRHIHFPVSAVFSAVVPLTDGSAIEVATIGNEGFIGADLLLGSNVSSYRVLAQVEGTSLRLPVSAFRDLITEQTRLRSVLDRYLRVLLHQAGQNSACNLRHGVEERMCRWLMMTQDRVGSDQFTLTQEFLAIMLGVRRQSVSLVASTLQDAGYITYSRGRIRILDRQGLEQSACECYDVLQNHYRQTMQEGSDGR